MDDTRIVYIADWNEDGIEDCIDCSESLCDYGCEGPKNLPEILKEEKNISDLYNKLNTKIDLNEDGTPNCEICSPERKLLFCESNHEAVGKEGIDAILISENYGLFPVTVCVDFDLKTKKCKNYESRPKICMEYACN